MNREEFALKILIADAKDIVGGWRKRRWLWFGIPPAAINGIWCSWAIDVING
jgi:hypothetical protein